MPARAAAAPLSRTRLRRGAPRLRVVLAVSFGAIGFLAIVDSVRDTVEEWLRERHADAGEPGTVEEIEEADRWARACARRHCGG